MVIECGEGSSGGGKKQRLCKKRKRRPRRRIKSKKNLCHSLFESGYTIDVANLLFTPQRDFLLKNHGQQVRADELKGKTIVLYIVPLYESKIKPGDTLDMIQAYNELLPLGGIEFVFVPIRMSRWDEHIPKPYHRFESQEAIFNHLFSAIPFPAVPFSDIGSCGDRVVKTFEFDGALAWMAIPFWVIIDPTNTVVLTRGLFLHLFKLFGGAELYPLSSHRLRFLIHEHGYGSRIRSRKRLINRWDQLLASTTRDFLLSSNGDQVPISSLKGKVVGLYFCENRPDPPRMKLIKEVYQEAKSLGHDFEIVQINFHYLFYNTDTKYIEDVVDLEDPCHQGIDWLTLPFKDPSCRKLQRIFKCDKDRNEDWFGDCLVIIDSREPDAKSGKVDFEFSGAEIMQAYGIESYPFTRQSLFKKKCRTQKKEVKLQLLFPPEQCTLMRPAGRGFCPTGRSHLFRKRVLVLFATLSECKSSTFVSMLKYKYREQVHIEEDKFEVIYVSTDRYESSFAECTRDMPWLVHPYSASFQKWCSFKVFNKFEGVRAAAFDINGELIGKEFDIKWSDSRFGRDKYDELRFPFVSQDLEVWVLTEIAMTVQYLESYYYSDDDNSDRW